MRKTGIKLLTMALISVFLLNGCKKHGHGLLAEEITTLEITFTPVEDSPVKLGTLPDPTVFIYRVIPGSDPEREITGPNIFRDLNYTYSIRFLDETNAPEDIIDLTEDIEAEGAEHLVCFEEIGSSTIVVSNQNEDINEKTLGTTGNIIFDEAGARTLKVLLKHEPNKNAANPCNTGSTDIEASFDFDVVIPI